MIEGRVCALGIVALVASSSCGAAPEAPVPPPAAPGHATPPTVAIAASTSPGDGPIAFARFPTRDEAPAAAVSRRCGRFTVTRRDHDGLLGHVTITTSGGSIVYDARPAGGSDRHDVGWCGDLDRDGRPELYLRHDSGGAHCCRTDLVLTLAEPPIERLRVEAGNAGGLEPADVDGRGAVELVSTDDALTELGDLPYAFTPFLPAVFALEGDRWARRTTRFVPYLENERAAARQELGACSGDATCQLGLAEKIAGISVMIGDWPAESARLALPADLLDKARSAAQRVAPLLRARGEALP